MNAATSEARHTILLTGFGPFPGIVDNASAHLVRRLARHARRALPDDRVTAAILPVDWLRAPRAISALHRRLNPTLALHFGVASNTTGFRLERIAANTCRSAPDAANALPSARLLIANVCESYRATVDTARIIAAVAAKGYPIEYSDDAGGYLCNAVLFHSLSEAQSRGDRCRVGFVHIPADLSGSELTRGSALAGALEIVKQALP